MAIVNPTPASSASVHIDSALSNFAVKYENSGFIADRVCPIIPVAKRSDTYFKRDRRDVSHAVNDVLSPKGRANEFRYSLSTASYAVQDRGLVDHWSGRRRLGDRDRRGGFGFTATENLLDNFAHGVSFTSAALSQALRVLSIAKCV